MVDPYGFLKIPRREARKRPVRERVADWQERLFGRRDSQTTLPTTRPNGKYLVTTLTRKSRLHFGSTA